jgi:hypothetical protein
MAALRVNGRVVALRELACRYLVDVGKGRFACSVYERRFEIAPWCLKVPQALPEGVLSPDCGYRGGRPAPDAPVRLNSRLVRLIAPQIRAAFEPGGWPEWVDAEHLPEWLRTPTAD